MEDNLKDITHFITSDQCIYDMQPIDYPNFLQQEFIHSYFTLLNLIDNDHLTITKNLYTYTQKSINTIAQGFIYSAMIQPQKLQQLLQYFMVLRVEVWQSICTNLEHLLRDQITPIKSKYKKGYGLIFQQLIKYRMASVEVCEMLIKNIDNYELTESTISVSHSLLTIFLKVMREEKDIPDPISNVFYHFLLFKCLKILSVKCKDLQSICRQIVDFLWKKDTNECARNAGQIGILLNQFPQYQTDVLGMIQPTIRQRQIDENDKFRIMTFPIIIPSKIHNFFLYILNENSDQNTTRIKLNWIFKTELDRLPTPSKVKILGDLARWLIFQDFNIEIRVYVLLWLVKTILGLNQNEGYFRLRWLLFIDWTNSNPQFPTILCSLHFLRFLLFYEPKIGEDFLVHILQFSIQNHQKLRTIFWQAHEQKFLKIQSITENIVISKAIKEEIIKIMGNIQEPKLQFNPDQESQESNSEQQLIYQLPQTQYESRYQLLLEENFIQEIDVELKSVLQAPSMETYKVFLAKVWKVCSGMIKDREAVECFTEETAKVTYILFNHEFQQMELQIKTQESVVYFLLKFIADEWKRVTNKLQITKKIIRKLMDLFPIGEICIWKFFLKNFKFGGANNREVKSWLFPKNKSNAVWMIEQMTQKVDKGLRSNASAYSMKIP